MLNQQGESPLTHQNSALASFKQEESQPRTLGREKQWCDHCKRPYHTKETCWKIHGKPRGKKESGRTAYIANAPKEAGNSTNLNLSEE